MIAEDDHKRCLSRRIRLQKVSEGQALLVEQHHNSLPSLCGAAASSCRCTLIAPIPCSGNRFH